MTIVAGFLGTHQNVDFVALGSDSEEGRTVGKTSVRKIATVDKGDCKCLIGGSGGGQFIDLAVQQFEATLAPPYTQAGVLALLDTIVTEIHMQRIDPLPERFQGAAEFELLCGVWVRDQGVRMVRVQRAVPLTVTEPCAIGWGSYLADYLIATLAFKGMDPRRCVRLLTYLLLQVKTHAKYCGGPSQVYVIDGNGVIQEMIDLVKNFDEQTTTIAMGGAASLVHFSDPLSTNLDPQQIDLAIDRAVVLLKRTFHARFDAMSLDLKRAIEANQKAAMQPQIQHAPEATPDPEPPKDVH